MPDGVLIVDCNGMARHNVAFARMWTLSLEIAPAGPSSAVFSHLFSQLQSEATLASQLSAVRNHPQTQTCSELTLSDGRIFAAQSSPLWTNHQSAGRVWCFRDITHQRRAEDLLKSRFRLTELAEKLPTIDLLRKTIDEAETLTQSTIGFLHLVDESTGTLCLQAWSTRTRTHMCKAEAHGMHYPIDRAGVWVDCIRRRQPVIHNDYASLPHRKGMPPGHAPVTRELVVPVMRQDAIVAVLGVGNKPAQYTMHDVDIVTQLANDAWEILLRKQAEEQLHKSEHRFRRIVESNVIGIVLADRRTSILLEANDAFLKIIGRTRDQLLAGALNWVDFTAPDTLAADLQAIKDSLATGVIPAFEKAYIRPDGTRVPVLIGGVMLDEARTQALAFVLDLTEKKRIEEQLRASTKLAATGRMAARIAHEINNPLAGIKNAFLLIKDAVTPEHPYFNYVAAIEQEIDRIGRIVRQMYSIYRPEPPIASTFSLVRTLGEVVDLVRRSCPRNVGIDLEPPDGPLDLFLPEDSLRQVLFNVLVNAAEASPDNGRVRVSVQRSQGVTIQISDQGPGIPEYLRSRIFEPFFSTKSDRGGGIGLGLSVSRSLIESMGGSISFADNSQQGTTFYIQISEKFVRKQEA